MGVLAAPELKPALTLIEGGRDERLERVRLENAWVEVQAVAHDASAFAGVVLNSARRIQVAIAAGRPGLAGQYAHELELAAPLQGYRARRSEIEAQTTLDDLEPKRPEPVG